MALNLKTLGTRALTALVFVTALLGSLLWNYTSFSLFFFVVAMLGLQEFYKLSEKFRARPYKITGFILGAILYGCFLQPFRHWQFILILIPFIIFFIALFHKRENPIPNALYTIAGLIYAVLPFGLLHTVVSGQESAAGGYSPDLLFGVILLIWSNDTFAYLGGSILGKHKMIERVSPGKTWEGTIFGVLMTIGSGYIIARFFLDQEVWKWLVLGILVPVLATLGDLVESLIKRQAGIKDSGRIMPGHGGILDRFDSLIFVSPFLVVVVQLTALPHVCG
jgi:phosphatidate cytidylyltransferase